MGPVQVRKYFSLFIMSYLFPSLSLLLTASTAPVSTTFFSSYMSPFVTHVSSPIGLANPLISRCCPSFLEGLILCVISQFSVHGVQCINVEYVGRSASLEGSFPMGYCLEVYIFYWFYHRTNTCKTTQVVLIHGISKDRGSSLMAHLKLSVGETITPVSSIQEKENLVEPQASSMAAN